MTHLSLSTNKTQTYSIKKKAVANHLRNQLKNIPENHFDQEVKSTTKMLASFASKEKVENFAVLSFLKRIQE